MAVISLQVHKLVKILNTDFQSFEFVNENAYGISFPSLILKDTATHSQ